MSAGFYLVLVQPFRLGDKVAVTCNLPNSGGAAVDSSDSRYRDVLGQFGSSGSASSAVMSHAQGWFEGVCEKVDLRYTVLRWVQRHSSSCHNKAASQMQEHSTLYFAGLSWN